jgi:hypothetical protein
MGEGGEKIGWLTNKAEDHKVKKILTLSFLFFFLFYTYLIPSPISRRIVLPFLVLSYRIFSSLLFLLVLSCLLTCLNKKKGSGNETDRWGPAELNRLQYSFCTTQWGPLFLLLHLLLHFPLSFPFETMPYQFVLPPLLERTISWFFFINATFKCQGTSSISISSADQQST